MWVLTENGRLINLDRFYTVDVEPYEATHLVVAHGDSDIQGYIYWEVLCSCDDEEHGREIIRHIADALADGIELYNIRDAKFSVYTCGVCDQRFEVPRRGGEVHYRLYDVVCPDCWATEKDEEAED